jgi:hypothetical protein
VYLLLRFVTLALGLALTSCQVLADIETRGADPLPRTCVLPPATAGDGNARARLAHLLPTTERIDVCVRLSGGPSYGRPVLRSSGADRSGVCGGLKYSEVTIPFEVPSGTIDFKIIPAGRTCSATALAETTGVEVGPDNVQTLVYMGPPEGPGTLGAFRETPSTKVVQNRVMRFVNTIAGTNLDFGVTETDKLPTDMRTPFLNSALPFGQVPARGMGAGTFEVDEYGYLAFLATKLPVAAAHRGTKKALLLANLEGAGYVTIYAIGSPGSAFPVRGLVCRDLEASPLGNPSLQNCAPTEIEAFRIDVFNAGLYGAFAAVEELRAARVISDLAARGATSDLLCVSELSRHEDLDLPEVQKGWTQDALKRAALEVPDGFRYFAQAQTDLDTMVSDPADQEGNIPPLPDRAPCDAAVDPAKLEVIYQCLTNNCSSIPGSFDGVTAGGTNCYSNLCGATALGPLLFGSPEDHQCFNCIVLKGLSYIPWGKNREQCATDPRRPYGFGGRTTSMLLSKLPLSDVEQFVIPTTVFRRTAVYAKMTLEGEQTMDVYCIHSPPLLGANMPYTGAYGRGASVSNGAAWQEEQIFGVSKVINWIKQKSGDRRALILGDFSSSAKVLDAEGKVILGGNGLPAVADVTPETLEQVGAAFTPAMPPGYKPECTRCPAIGSGDRLNPYNKGFNDPMWTLRVFIHNPWGQNLAQSAGLFYTEPDRVVFPMENLDFGLVGPLSDTYGFNVTVQRP